MSVISRFLLTEGHKICLVPPGVQGWPGGSLGTFTSLGGTCTSVPAAARNTDGRLQVFVRGLDRRVYSRLQGTAGGAFTSTWHDLGGSL